MKDCIYLDHQATTPVDPRVFDKMTPYFCEDFANPSSRTHLPGRDALTAVQKARAQVAHLVAARRPQEILFTSGATESNNLAILGSLGLLRDHQRIEAHVITSEAEHKAVLDPFHRLESWGLSLTVLPVDDRGCVSVQQVEEAIDDRTRLVSLMFANNEIGSINPVAEIGSLTRKRGILFHVDGAQAVGKIPVSVSAMNIDLLSVSGHKMYGPKGVGALYVCSNRTGIDPACAKGRSRNASVALDPILVGGDQELGVRAGTLNVPGIVGLGEACALAEDQMEEDRAHLDHLTRKLWDRLTQKLDRIFLNGPEPGDSRLPGNLSVRFEGVEGSAIMEGVPEVAVSAGSACTSAQTSPSHVLQAIGLSPVDAFSTLRFGMGRFNREEDVIRAANLIAAQVSKLRAGSRGQPSA